MKISYVEARDKLIPEAEQRADNIVGTRPKHFNFDKRWEFEAACNNWSNNWNKHFFMEMNSLVWEHMKNSDGSFKEYIE